MDMSNHSVHLQDSFQEFIPDERLALPEIRGESNLSVRERPRLALSRRASFAYFNLPLNLKLLR